MKSEIRNPKVSRVEYPKLVMTEDGTVLLLSDYGKGMVVHAANPLEIGYYSETWGMSGYADFNGEVLLSNK